MRHSDAPICTFKNSQLWIQQAKETEMIKSNFVDKDIQKYLNQNCIRLTPVERKLYEQSVSLSSDIRERIRSVDCSQLLQVLIKSSRAKFCLDIGSLTCYNAITMAMALPADGKVITIDVTDKNIIPLSNLWKEAGVNEKVKQEIKSWQFIQSFWRYLKIGVSILR